MSIGNTNFITLDSIAEIQDIVNGDYLFTVSDGVIYKLDFQNLILTADNVDFYSTIESLSSQVVSLTNAFSSVNAQVNQLSSALGASSVIASGSANWNSTYNTVSRLSSTNWLPYGNVKSGSLVKYEGGSSAWKVIEPGQNGDVLQVRNNTPQFTGTTIVQNNIVNLQNNYNSDTTIAGAINNIPTVNGVVGGENFSWIGINWDVAFSGGDGDAITNESALLITYTDGRPQELVQGGTYYIEKGTNGNSQPITFTVIPQAKFGIATFTGIQPNTSARKVEIKQDLGSFTALGNPNDTSDKRPFTNDPDIISNVLNSKFDEFVPLVYNQGNIPGTFSYTVKSNPPKSYTFKLWNTAVVTLKVYGTSS